MRPAWGNPRGLRIRSGGDNVFVAVFANKADRDRAQAGTPWMVGNRHAVLLQDYDPRLRPSDVRFDSMAIWVRVFNLPFEWMNDRKGLKIARLIDKNCSVDVDEFGEASGTFLRAKVAIPIAEPLRRWVTIRRDNKDVRFDLQYEKLPFYCFSCGLIGHGELECKNPADRDVSGKLPFDRNLRALEERRRRPQSFGQAAASASWNSSSRERGGGSGKSFPSPATSRTSHESASAGAAKADETEVTSPIAKEKVAPQSSRVAEIAKNLFSAGSAGQERQVRKRKPDSEARAKSAKNTEGKLVGLPTSGLELSLVVAGKDHIHGTVVSPGGHEEIKMLSKKHKNDQFGSQALQGSMKAIAYNCRGLGNQPAVQGLLELQKAEDLDILFLSETKLDRERMKRIKVLLGMPNMEAKDCEGRSGGLALLWKKDVIVKVNPGTSRYHIDAEVTGADGFVWRLTGIYGEPNSGEKEKTWKLLRILHGHSSFPWMCFGDFNEILFASKKQGGQAKSQACMDKFRSALEFCELEDLGFVGDLFTWRNHSHRADSYIKERLDRTIQILSLFLPFLKVGKSKNEPLSMMITKKLLALIVNPQPLIKEFIRFGAQFVGYRDFASKAEEKLAEVNERANTLAQKLEQSEEARKTSQEFELEDPDNDPLLDALSFLEFHGTEAREGIDQAKAGLSRLFPYFFPKKEEPATFLALAKCFNPPEDLGLKVRQKI
ncbi:hypothetical protein QYE76_025324 [Lolium multiflorum]|uniref:CCHC-type domain-containing protein n=1 Tax=Lolium multiflorum TaxID=4521 RepID=A0AAD8RF02_LOLMU|nr:hypothetical protein QYE76_025324 [Lolium multiflorum]